MFLKLMNRIYLSKLSGLINRQDKRSARKWCVKSHLQIYRNSSGEFVNESEFEVVYNLPVINQLKSEYGNSWIEYYEAYNNGELYKMLDLNETNAIKEKTGYVPKGKLSVKLFGGSLK